MHDISHITNCSRHCRSGDWGSWWKRRPIQEDNAEESHISVGRSAGQRPLSVLGRKSKLTVIKHDSTRSTNTSCPENESIQFSLHANFNKFRHSFTMFDITKTIFTARCTSA